MSFQLISLSSERNFFTIPLDNLLKLFGGTKNDKVSIHSCHSLFNDFNVIAQENIRKIATWNMKWLGTNSGNQLNAIENISPRSMLL